MIDDHAPAQAIRDGLAAHPLGGAVLAALMAEGAAPDAARTDSVRADSVRADSGAPASGAPLDVATMARLLPALPALPRPGAAATARDSAIATPPEDEDARALVLMLALVLERLVVDGAGGTGGNAGPGEAGEDAPWQ